MIDFKGAPAVRLIKRFPSFVKERERQQIHEAISRVSFSLFVRMPETAIWHQGIEGFSHSMAFIPSKNGTFISRVVILNEDGAAFDLTRGKWCVKKGSAKKLGMDQLRQFIQSHGVQLPDHEEDLRTLGLSLDEKRRIVEYVSDHWEEWGALKKNHRVHRAVSGLANSLLVIPDRQGGVKKILMRLDPEIVGIVGSGGQRDVEFAFDLTAGDMLATKKLIGKEKGLVAQLQGCKGVCGVICLRKSGRLFAPLYDGVISKLIQEVDLTLMQKRKIMSQLLKGLVAIHQLTTSRGDPAFHSDIKPKNILFRLNDLRLVTVIDDFGLCNRRRNLAGTPKWTSPEHAQALLSMDYSKELAYEANRRHGQALDVWAMGLVFHYLLTRSSLPGWMPAKMDTSQDIITKIAGLTQREVYYPLFLRGLQATTKTEKALWELLHRMLQVDPKKRIDAYSALQLLKNS